MSRLSSILKSEVELPQSKQLVLNLLCTNNYVADQYAIFFKSQGLTASQYNVLRILRGQNGKPANLSTIQERMVHKNSNAGRLIDKLLIKGFVERNQCEVNRRKIEVTITNSGLQKLLGIAPDLEKIEEYGVRNLSIEEIKTLNSLLEKLRT